MLLQLQANDITLIYKNSKHMYLADTLSRSPDTSASQTSVKTDTFEVMSVSYISTARLKALRMHSAQDQILQTLTTVIQHGWPDKECMLPRPIRAFFPYRDELATEDGIVVNGHRAVIPYSLQQRYIIQHNAKRSPRHGVDQVQGKDDSLLAYDEPRHHKEAAVMLSLQQHPRTPTEGTPTPTTGSSFALVHRCHRCV